MTMENTYAVCNICGGDIVYLGSVYWINDCCLCPVCEGSSMTVFTTRIEDGKTEEIVREEIISSNDFFDDDFMNANHLDFQGESYEDNCK